MDFTVYACKLQSGIVPRPAACIAASAMEGRARSRSPRRSAPPGECLWTGVSVAPDGGIWHLQDIQTIRAPLGILQVREVWVQVLPPPQTPPQNPASAAEGGSAVEGGMARTEE